MKKPRVTFGLVSYNGAYILPDCMEAIKKQKCKVSKIVIIDDFSKDNTVEVVKKLKKKYPIWYKRVPHGGTAKASKVMLEKCLKTDCDYIALLAEDSILADNWFVEMEKMIKKYKCDGATSTQIEIKDNFKKTHDIVNKEIAFSTLKHPVQFSFSLSKKQTLKNLKYDPHLLIGGEDLDAMLQLLEQGKKYCTVLTTEFDHRRTIRQRRQHRELKARLTLIYFILKKMIIYSWADNYVLMKHSKKSPWARHELKKHWKRIPFLPFLYFGFMLFKRLEFEIPSSKIDEKQFVELV